ncbi:MAG: PqqD family peptide modification chaperone [Helicobacteraceae bacterium]|nr:PqqD family peptide modification chaperone [Helicobacteraceae bacterium]
MQQATQLLLDENNIAFHPIWGNSYQVNDIAKDILTLVKQDKTKDEILEQLSAEYEISKEELFIDLGDFFSKLKIYGLVS